MAVPWLQIVQLVPSIVEVSRELLKRTSKTAPPPSGAQEPPSANELAARVASLEENERRQAVLVSQMADQLAGLTRAVTALHRRLLWLTAATALSLVIAAGALTLLLVR
ncbi:MAG TPA: hypothetical protein VF193_17395 [Steroidobacter sp.]